MNIRLLTKDDLSKILPGAREFYGVSALPGELDQEWFLKSWERLIESGKGVILAVEHEDKIVAGIGGVEHESIFNDLKWMTEMFWYALPEYRDGTGIKLLRAFEKEAERRGCQIIMMAYLFNSMPEKVKRIYEIFKYQPIEEWYYKEL